MVKLICLNRLKGRTHWMVPNIINTVRAVPREREQKRATSIVDAGDGHWRVFAVIHSVRSNCDSMNVDGGCAYNCWGKGKETRRSRWTRGGGRIGVGPLVLFIRILSRSIYKRRRRHGARIFERMRGALLCRFLESFLRTARTSTRPSSKWVS